MDFFDEQFAYYQDPNFGVEFNEYGNEIVDASPPPTDKKWVDPMKVNKAYLSKIKKDHIQEEFQNLKTEGLFLLEVLVERIELNSEVVDNKVSKDLGDQMLVTYIKILDFPFLEVEDIYDEPKTKDSVPLYEDLLQTVYTSTRALSRTVSGCSEEEKEEGSEENKSLSECSDSSERKNSETKKDSNNVEKKMFEVMKGKCALFSTTGQEAIKTLLKKNISVRVMVRGQIEKEHSVEDTVLETSSFRTPEILCLSVIQSAKSDTRLPFLVTGLEKHVLLDTDGDTVGEITLNISLTSFGKAVINCVREVDDEEYKYQHTTALRSLKRMQGSPSADLFPVNPRLALEILDMGLPKLIFKTSAEILQKCLTSNWIEVVEEERKRALGNRDCQWLSMVEDVLPKEEPISTSASEHLLQIEEIRMAALWRKHEEICRDMKTKPALLEDDKRSLYERLEELQIQTEIAILDEDNPFVEQAQTSLKELAGVESFERKESKLSESRARPKSSLRSGH